MNGNKLKQLQYKGLQAKQMFCDRNGDTKNTKVNEMSAHDFQSNHYKWTRANIRFVTFDKFQDISKNSSVQGRLTPCCHWEH